MASESRHHETECTEFLHHFSNVCEFELAPVEKNDALIEIGPASSFQILTRTSVEARVSCSLVVADLALESTIGGPAPSHALVQDGPKVRRDHLFEKFDRRTSTHSRRPPQVTTGCPTYSCNPKIVCESGWFKVGSKHTS